MNSLVTLHAEGKNTTHRSGVLPPPMRARTCIKPCAYSHLYLLVDTLLLHTHPYTIVRKITTTPSQLVKLCCSTSRQNMVGKELKTRRKPHRPVHVANWDNLCSGNSCCFFRGMAWRGTETPTPCVCMQQKSTCILYESGCSSLRDRRS